MSSSYANEMTSPETEMGGDAVGAGGFFADSKSRHADLRAMLDSNKDNLKQEAMKRIINMMAKGRDVSDLFPAVVKNVAAKNIEVKKLVYVYLVRYAEEQQDLALLSISTFQRALKDPNQLIRASALRVLSSIRVPMIAPILMLAIKESIRDMSPYVRKVSAHAIPKLNTLDPDQREQLIEVIDFLLADKTTLVVGSAVYAYEEVCPEEHWLLHKHYRKLCHVIMDVDEWGQVLIINLLTRYARTQFASPLMHEMEEQSSGKFYSDDSESDESKSEKSETDSDKEDKDFKDKDKEYVMDPDLRLLLRNTKALLQSRNSAVVLAVAQLYYHLAPRNEMSVIVRAMIRLLRSAREVQSVVLMNIATISARRRVFTEIYAISKNMFEPFLKSFFVRSSDPTHVKLLKLEILTNLATQSNISIILREFQTYVHTDDREFAAASIDAIGRCAGDIAEVTDVCLSGLVGLMASKNETVVAQSVVVIKRLLQLQPDAHHDIIARMAKLLDSVKVAAARASIVWLIGEYNSAVPHIAPDILRILAKNFSNEEDVVKLQVMNLAVKLYLVNKEQTCLLCEYVFNMAKYDQSYDVRDRMRLLRALTMNGNGTGNALTHKAHDIFLSQKPAPVLESAFKDRDEFQLGTLSHYLNQRCAGYQDLPDFPSTPPNGDARNVPGYETTFAEPDTKQKGGLLGAGPGHDASGTAFYSDQDSQTDSDTSDSDSSSESGSASSGSAAPKKAESASSSSQSESESESSSGSSSEEEAKPAPKKQVIPKKTPAAPPVKKTEPVKMAKADVKKKGKQTAPAVDLLLDFGSPPSESVLAQPTLPMTNSVSGPSALQPLTPRTQQQVNGHQKDSKTKAMEEYYTAAAQAVPSRTHELLSAIVSNGLRVQYRFTRTPSLQSSAMTSIELQLTNQSQMSITQLKCTAQKVPTGMSVQGLESLSTSISANNSNSLTIGVDFGDTTQTMTLLLSYKMGDEEPCSQSMSLTAPVGEQIQPVLLTPQQFKQQHARLSGLNETCGQVSSTLSVNDRAVIEAVYDVANVIQIDTSTDPNANQDEVCMAGQTLSCKCLVLICIQKNVSASDKLKLVINTEKMVIGSMLFKQIKEKLAA